MARRYRTVHRLIQRPPNLAGNIALIPPRGVSPWAHVGRAVAFPGVIEQARQAALPGREIAHVNEVYRVINGA